MIKWIGETPSEAYDIDFTAESTCAQSAFLLFIEMTVAKMIHSGLKNGTEDKCAVSFMQP